MTIIKSSGVFDFTVNSRPTHPNDRSDDVVAHAPTIEVSAAPVQRADRPVAQEFVCGNAPAVAPAPIEDPVPVVVVEAEDEAPVVVVEAEAEVPVAEVKVAKATKAVAK